ncbi:MAG: DNA-binding response regulator [Gammaproteobacteria bacterium RBG_16_51_14]|nr:MAG: DNA-binding response regulator [Gammaproteobacteria bacterium RBG_16_51_14]
MRILLAEDDPILGDGIATGLREYGFTVNWLTDGKAIETALDSEKYEVLILDIGLPGKSGLEILENLRRKNNNLPVLILTARDTVHDRIRGLDTGADDYMIKPFDLNELAARIRALIRRHHGRVSPTLEHRNIVMDPAGFTVTLDNEPVRLTRREFLILKLLLENRGIVLTRNSMEESLYPWDEGISSNTIEVHIHHLRKKFGSDMIKTVREVGYTIEK